MSTEALSQLATGMRGSLVTPEDSGFDEARRVWNGTVDKKPAAIVRCQGVADVIDAVNFAREHRLQVSVRGGGHHVAGSAVLDGGLVIDLSQMRSVRVDPETRRVQAEGGAQIGDVDRETQAFSLAVPLGLVSETGVAGLTLAGGLSWLRRKHGLACDNLVSADLVLSDGRYVHASAAENPELFWALRGGGWDLGVVTSFEYTAHPLGPDVFMSFVTYPRTEGQDVLRRFEEQLSKAPPGAAPLAVCWTFPEADIFPSHLWGQQFVAVIGAYAGPAEEGARAMQPFSQLGTVLTDMSDTVPYVQAQRFFDEDYPKGRRYYWRSTYLRELSSGAIDALLSISDLRPSPLSSVDVWPQGGAISQVTASDSPFGHRDAPYAIGLEANWDDPAADGANIAWAREAAKLLEPYSTGGSYMNFEDPDDPKATAGSYGANLQRLIEVKRKYDPINLFRSRLGLVD